MEQRNVEQVQTLQGAISLGIERGHDINQSRTEQRIVIAKRVKALRVEKGLSQTELSEAINANFLTYKGYENCKSDIPMFYLVRIADKLNTSLDYLAGRTNNSSALNENLKEQEQDIETKLNSMIREIEKMKKELSEKQ